MSEFDEQWDGIERRKNVTESERAIISINERLNYITQEMEQNKNQRSDIAVLKNDMAAVKEAMKCYGSHEMQNEHIKLLSSLETTTKSNQADIKTLFTWIKSLIGTSFIMIATVLMNMFSSRILEK